MACLRPEWQGGAAMQGDSAEGPKFADRCQAWATKETRNGIGTEADPTNQCEGDKAAGGWGAAWRGWPIKLRLTWIATELREVTDPGEA